jgi:NH3-dependent NAD+ synthetase
MSQVAEKLGVTEQKLKINKTISNLIPQLGQLLNDKVISQFAAYQILRRVRLAGLCG